MNKLFLIFIFLLAGKAGAQAPALTVADSLYAIGNYSEALLQLDKIDPKTETVQLKMARNFQAKGDLPRALENYRQVLGQNPGRVLTALDYGKLLIRTGELESADSLFTDLAEKYPENANFRYQLGLVKENRNDSTATNHFMMTIFLDKYHQGALFRVAKNQLSKRGYAVAEKFSKQGLEANPVNASLLSILAQTYYNQKLYDLAISEFEKLLDLGQGNEFVHSRLGFCYYQEKDFKKAIEQYNQALEIEDRNSDTHYNLGKLYALTGDLKKSEMHLLMSVLIKKQPVDAEYLSLALTYKLQKKHKDALDYFNKALEENPDNERALYERAVAADNYFKDRQTVLDHYQAYLNKYEDNGREGMVYLTKTRMSDIKKEMFLAKD